MKIETHIKQMKKAIDSMPSEMVKQAGKKAMEWLADYPLYACTSNIGYTDAIIIAVTLGAKI